MASAPSAPSAVEIRQYRHDEVAGGGLELFGSPFSSAWRFHLARQWTGSGGCVSAPADPAVVSSLRLSSCTFFLSERRPHGPSPQEPAGVGRLKSFIANRQTATICKSNAEAKGIHRVMPRQPRYCGFPCGS